MVPRYLFLFFAGLFLPAANGFAQETGERSELPPPEVEQALFAPVPLLTPTPLPSGALLLDEESARRALALGFASVAAAQAEQLVQRSTDGGAARDAAVLLLTTARLELGDVRGAADALAQHSDARPPSHRLRAGLIALREGRLAEAKAASASLRVDDLAKAERAWLYLLQGMIAEATPDPAAAATAYDQAYDVAVSEWQKARLSLARGRLRLVQGQTTPPQAEELLQQAERFAGRSLATDFAIQYAVALALLGQAEIATGYLQTHLATLTDATTADSRDDVHLMLGLLAGPLSGEGRGALEQLLGGGRDAGKQRMGLMLLMEGADDWDARARLRRLLDDLLARVPQHGLTEELLLARGELALIDQSYAAAEGDAKNLLARFPVSPQRARALTQLASIAWELKRFRTAGDFAAQAASASAVPEERAALLLLAAEASYRAEDYPASAELYATVINAPPPGVVPADVMFQATMAEIAAKRLSKAGELIDRLATDPRFDVTTRWQAEWNLARALQAEGQSELALGRLRRLVGQSGSEQLAPALGARLAWLQARLARETGRMEEALALAQALPAQLGGVEAVLAREITGLARLVAAEALFGLDRANEALRELQSLRAELPASEAAIQSFIVEADIQATVGDLVEAQQLLIDFSQDHKEHKFAPYAIYQAALSAERRGENVYLRQAYVLLEGLVKAYPSNELIFDARKKQGDLLRRLGDFAAAQRIYELLTNDFAQHRNRAAVLGAQMALADSHRAQAVRDPSHFESAIAILERLRDLADAPTDVRAEAGFKLGDMLAERAPTEALAAWGAVAGALVSDSARASELGSQGRYWMGRLLLRAAELLEQRGDDEQAREMWSLVVQRGLPGFVIAQARLAVSANGVP